MAFRLTKQRNTAACIANHCSACSLHFMISYCSYGMCVLYCICSWMFCPDVYIYIVCRCTVRSYCCFNIIHSYLSLIVNLFRFSFAPTPFSANREATDPHSPPLRSLIVILGFPLESNVNNAIRIVYFRCVYECVIHLLYLQFMDSHFPSVRMAGLRQRPNTPTIHLNASGSGLCHYTTIIRGMIC